MMIIFDDYFLTGNYVVYSVDDERYSVVDFC